MSEVIFEVTRDHLETGLRGYPVGYCATSTVDPMKGLSYAGKPVEEMAFWEPEKVIYLLYYGKEGSPQEVEAFKQDLQRRAPCPNELLKHIRMMPRVGHPMNLFAAAILIAGMFECKDDYQEDCLNLIAKIPEITACLINYHAGWN